MTPLRRDRILDYVTYEEQRPSLRPFFMEQRNARRVPIGSTLTLSFENTETVRYQVQEMIRSEHMVREADIQHEIDTYNELLGGPGELGAVLMIEIEDPVERDRCLSRWLDLPQHVYVRLEDGTRIAARYDPRQVGDTRLSSVQFLKFQTGGRVPVAAGCDHPELRVEVPLTDAQQAALRADLGVDGGLTAG
jgi:hypothetical protein